MHKHNPINERGENYCQDCGEVFDVDMVAVINRHKFNDRFSNNCLNK